MKTLRDAHEVSAYMQKHRGEGIAHLMQQRLDLLADCDDMAFDELALFIVVEPGDSLQKIDAAVNGTLLVNPSTGKVQGDEGFIPLFELLEEHANCYEWLFIQGDDGFGIEVFVPKRPDIHPDVTALCRRYATPSEELKT